MKREIISISALILCAVVCVVPLVSNDCDADTHYVQFHDEFHGDFWMKTDDRGYLSYEQLQDPRLVPTQEGYEFKGWFQEDGRELGLAMKITSDLYIVGHYEKIEEDIDFSKIFIVAILIVFLVILVGVFFYTMKKKRGS